MRDRNDRITASSCPILCQFSARAASSSVHLHSRGLAHAHELSNHAAMTTLFTYDSSEAPLRDRTGPPEEILADLAATLRNGPWTGVDVRLLLLPSAEGREEQTGYLALRGVFAAWEPLQRCWHDPPMWRGGVSVREAADAADAWAKGGTAQLGSVALSRPEFHSLHGEPRPSVHLTSQRLLGNDAFGIPADWSFSYWRVYGNGGGVVAEPTALSLVDAAARWTGGRPADVFRYHLGEDLTHTSAGRFEAFLPSPYAVRLDPVGEGELAVILYSRGDDQAPPLWATAGSGPWDMRMERHRRWSPIEAPPGWGGFRQILAVDPQVPVLLVWIGKDDEPWLTVAARAPVTGLAAQREAAWRLLQEQQKSVEALVALTARDKMKNGAAFLELGVGNALVAAGWQVLHGGVPAAVEGIDLVAFHEPSQRALCLSITLGNNLGEKLRRMLDTRQSLAPVLSEWRPWWAILTSLDGGNIVAGDVEDCLRQGVSVLTSEDLHMIARDVRYFAEHLVVQLKQDAQAWLLRGASNPLR